MREEASRAACLPLFFLFDSVLDHVDIEMVVGHLDAVGGKGLADLFVHAVIDRPVVGGGDPEPDEVGDAARAVFAEDDRGRGLVRHLRKAATASKIAVRTVSVGAS